MGRIDAIDSAVFMLRNGYTTAEVVDALRVDDAGPIRHLRAALRYLDGRVPREVDAREARLGRIQKGRFPAEHIRLLLRQGLTNMEVRSGVRKEFPRRSISLQHISQIRMMERKKGVAVPTCLQARRLRKTL